jgi:TRAP-type mannitol/chloroaromatic compound transport system permease small subunit
MKILRAVYDGVGVVSEWAGRVAVLLIVVLIAIVNYEVVMRYLFNAPTLWSHVLSYLFGAISACLGLAYVWRHNANIRIDVLYNRFSPRAKLWVDIVFTLVIFFPCITMLTIQFAQVALNSYRIGETVHLAAWHPLLWPVRTCVFIGFSLLLLQGIATFLKNVASLLRSGEEPW